MKNKISLTSFIFINVFMFLTILFKGNNDYLVGMEIGISEHLSVIFYLLAFILSFWTFCINKKIDSAYSFLLFA
tara:strand:+ start:329 stop:550 length:222 start_codon:yes stop_codon:yes gene_type:complete